MRLAVSLDPLRVRRGSSSGTSRGIVPLMQLIQDLAFEIQDERAAGFGTLESDRIVQRLTLTQSFDRLPVILAQSMEKAVVRTVLLDSVRKVRKPLDDVPCPIRHGCSRRFWSISC
jgi:hypothetical protein